MYDISIITPSFNQGRFIERTIRSVLNQHLAERSLEYVVLDGASTDSTLDVLQSFDGQLEWVSGPDEGQAHAINKGLRTTTGSIIGWLNSDDIYYPETLQSVCKFFDEHPEIDVVYGDANHIDEDDFVIGPYDTEAWDIERLKDVCFLCQPAVFLRRRVVERLGGLDQRLNFCMDYEYWLRLVQAGVSFAHLRRTLAGSRLYPETKTLGSRISFHTEINDMLRARLGRVPDRWLFNFAHAILEPSWIKPSRPLLFALAVSVVSVYASLRWNRSVSRQMLLTTRHWIGEAARAMVQRMRDSDPTQG